MKKYFIEFPLEEYQARVARAVEGMAKLNVDCVLVTQKENMRYFTAYRSGLFMSKYWTAGMGAFILPGRDPVMMLPDVEGGACMRTSWCEDIRIWSPLGKLGARFTDPLEHTIDIIRDLRLDGARIGVELGRGTKMSLAATGFEALRSALPGVEFVDVADLITGLRMVKSPAEISRIRRACEVNEAATDAAWEFLRTSWRRGVTQIDVARVIKRTMIDQGAEDIAFCCVRSGPPLLDVANAYPLEIRVKKGDLIQLDIGCVCEGYCSDYQRMASIGPPPDEWVRMYEVERQAQAGGVNLVRPGLVVEEIDKFTQKVITDAGFGQFIVHRSGHGIGLEVHERPSVGIGDKTVLRAGMTITVEPGIHPAKPAKGAPGAAAFIIEDVVAVTEEGHELLTTYDRDLHVI